MFPSARRSRPAGVEAGHGDGWPVRGHRRWAELATRADEPDVQQLIRRGIRAGAIRVVPAPDGSILILSSARRPRPSPTPCPATADGLDLTSLPSPPRS